jgi:hypothetical protein
MYPFCQRGEMENRINEQQLDLFYRPHELPSIPGQSISSALELGGLRLGASITADALAGTELATAQIGTVRLKLFKVAARVVVLAQRVAFHLASSYPYHELFRTALDRLVSGPRPVADEAG